MKLTADHLAACDSEAARWLPWYLTGQIGSGEAARVALHLETCALCRADLEEQRQVRELMRADDAVQLAPQAGLAATLARIDELERSDSVLSGQTRAGRVVVRTRRTTPLTRWLVAAVIVQAIGIGVLSTAFLRRAPATRASADYEVLSTPVSVARAPAIRVVFNDNLPVVRLQSVLAREGLHAVSGPGRSGVFTLAYDAGAVDDVRVEGTLRALRANADVRFAEALTSPGMPAP